MLDEYASNESRPIDVLFIGGYSRHHRRRAQLLEKIASLHMCRSVVMHLDQSRLARFAESPVGSLFPLASHRRPLAVRTVSRPALFGRSMYAALSQAKVVLTGAVDMAGSDRGNMRCFEAFGGGCALLTDVGDYPEGMVSGNTMLTYDDHNDAVAKLSLLLESADLLPARVTRAGNAMVRTVYSKRKQIERFYELVA